MRSFQANNIALDSVNKENALDFSSIKENFNKYIVIPANAFGLGGFVFDIEGETTNDLRADITDHYLEDNEPVQDHIAVKPLRVTLQSYAGELVYETDNTTNTAVQKVVQKLTILSAYLPVLSESAQQIQSSLQTGALTFSRNGALDLVKKGFQQPNLNNIVDLWALTKNLNPGASRQQQAYLYLKALMQQKLLVSLQTPFEFVTNMAIESISARQEENTRSMCDFTISLKKIRTVEVKVTGFDPKMYQNRSEEQISPLVEQGNNQGSEVIITNPNSPVKALINKVFNF